MSLSQWRLYSKWPLKNEIVIHFCHDVDVYIKTENSNILFFSSFNPTKKKKKKKVARWGLLCCVLLLDYFGTD